MEEEYADIYYVDSRNAAVRDHTRRPGQTVPWRPRPTPPPMVPTRTVYMPPQPVFANQAQQVMYPGQFPGQFPATGTAAMLLGRFTIAQVVEAIAQGIAAMKSLPTAPVATRDVETDVANMVLYQTALADHAKFDERIRTLGGIIAKLAG